MQLINKKTLLSKVPLSARTIDNLEKQGRFPRRIAISDRRVAWDLVAVEEWLNERKASNQKIEMPKLKAA